MRTSPYVQRSPTTPAGRLARCRSSHCSRRRANVVRSELPVGATRDAEPRRLGHELDCVDRAGVGAGEDKRDRAVAHIPCANRAIIRAAEQQRVMGGQAERLAPVTAQHSAAALSAHVPESHCLVKTRRGEQRIAQRAQMLDWRGVTLEHATTPSEKRDDA